MNYTTVIGVDKDHLKQLEVTWPTWVKNKPSLLEQPMVVFYDATQIKLIDVEKVVEAHPHVTFFAWPLSLDVDYGNGTDKWDCAQRFKMLSGFVHVPSRTVRTEYWLKLDVDVVAQPGYDDWIDESWFEDKPAIVAQKWGFTKPADQMIQMDQWIEQNKDKGLSYWNHLPPLELKPKEGWSRVRHKRIISWCGFFNTSFTLACSEVAERICGPGLLPIHSQDGYLWYMAARGQWDVIRTGFKSRGWQHWLRMDNLVKHAQEALDG